MNEDESILPGNYIAGFVDGEGCFYLTYRKETKKDRKNKPVYFRWVTYFAIVLKKDDILILQKIKKRLGCGKISFTRDQARYNVQDIKENWEKIIPFFEKYQLRAKKRQDFLLWKEAVSLVYEHLYNKNPYSLEKQKRLIKIRYEMKEYKSRREKTFQNFPFIK